MPFREIFNLILKIFRDIDFALWKMEWQNIIGYFPTFSYVYYILTIWLCVTSFHICTCAPSYPLDLDYYVQKHILYLIGHFHSYLLGSSLSLGLQGVGTIIIQTTFLLLVMLSLSSKICFFLLDFFICLHSPTH